MKIWLYCAAFVLCLFSGLCVAQVPGPAFVPLSNEMSGNFVLPVKGYDLSTSGYGGQVAVSHFLRNNFGVQMQGDYERTNFANFRSAGGRIGPIVRFATKGTVQPYLELLAGYAEVEAVYLTPKHAVSSYHGSGSVLCGGGLDYRLANGWYARAGLDLEDDWAARSQVARGTVGFSYRFGE